MRDTLQEGGTSTQIFVLFLAALVCSTSLTPVFVFLQKQIMEHTQARLDFGTTSMKKSQQSAARAKQLEHTPGGKRDREGPVTRSSTSPASKPNYMKATASKKAKTRN